MHKEALHKDGMKAEGEGMNAVGEGLWIVGIGVGVGLTLGLGFMALGTRSLSNLYSVMCS